MPPHTQYVEPYFGGGSVLLAKDPEGVAEVVNDLDGDLMAFWRVMQHDGWFDEFKRLCEATPFSEDQFGDAMNSTPHPADVVARAWVFFVRCRMSLAGRAKAFTGITKTRTRRGMQAEVSAWLSAIDGLGEVHSRLKRVLILDGRDATELVEEYGRPGTLLYLDPPYLHSTRATTGEYTHEMDAADHYRLLRTARSVHGYVMISGYRSELYDSELQGWGRVDFDMPNHAAGGESKRRMTECVWMNFRAES